MRTNFYRFSFLLIVLSLSCNHALIAQAGWWTWLSGSNTLGATAVYGTQGVPSVLNHPSGAYEQNQWKDNQGNFWVYGGTYPNLDDLWKYDPVTNEWTWVRGTGTANVTPTYGTQGVPDPANQPGERSYGAGTWTDNNGNLWIFGGAVNFGSNNDLWKYDISTNEWTWMKGSNIPDVSGVHGVLGVPSPLTEPGARTEAYSTWTDLNNNLWLYGGLGYDDGGFSGSLGDLCKYDISTNEWTWMHGPNMLANLPTYGTLGVSSATNEPGGRYTCSVWPDLQGNLWLFGGGANGNRNDVWKFDQLVNEWTWMAGPNVTNDLGSYQTQCTYGPNNYPEARFESRASTYDKCGNLWLFGGMDAGVLNDLWVFNTQLLQWSWQSGTNTPNQPGNWGTMGVASATNMPASRCSGVAWWGNDNKFYMFGGPDAGVTSGFADLWVYNPDTSCVANCAYPFAVFIAPNHICPGTCTDFTNLSSNATSFLWTFNGASTTTSTDVNPQNICYNTPGSYGVTLIASNGAASDTLTLLNFITVYPYPPPQGISQSGDTLFANPGAVTYQWYQDGNIIPGATNYFYVAQSSGSFNVVATDNNGCEVEAVIFDVIAGIQSAMGNGELAIYPNPVTEKFTIHNAQFTMGTAVEISIYNMVGELVKVVRPSSVLGPQPFVFDVSYLSKGVYWLEVSSNEKTFRARFIKQ